MNDHQMPTAVNLRLFALTAAVASILKHLPAAKDELLSIAASLDDAPPVAVSDELLQGFAQEIRDVVAGKWK
ncbi:hypothetical protein [Variovorax arabinosiphilus]|uniref:hypothetical protein n=1 Tax=Variovorax arabinosiphilus TaxID=3053498 RepID=UPI0025777A7B|nr:MULTISPECIES: hypothetical protein [unclassified Variovorax]MDM0118434.1 hypothetical protein [Variovorax sp. J2L1-78]MDM0128859.1 hypothetical protein [Variovorax sp. J2L1-63]MDM0233355.1 hypothetical protein [Variovorax sp. J2R1-6]